ncbi:cellulose biosynthesis protein BcsS [Methylobacterium radiodurans]|uniref:Cellulose biosynthesis protein BcsS n=2 Tax=Methylobacterium radiodurans TaxID=2202828 RepID=A0A2U8VRA5_9HYPH|nr:cellulose biosynthesis protein BcsS [Methylobacterium radiodurans]
MLAPGPTAAAEGWETVLFGSLDAGAATFLSAGGKVAPGGAGRDGFILLASVGAGHRRERGVCACARLPVVASLTRTTALGAAVVGYQWSHDWGVVALLAGPEGSAEMLSGSAGDLALPARWGLRLHGEVWARPTAETLLQATAILGSSRADAWGRLAWGYRLWGAYLGPEASLFVDRTAYRKWNLGLHATDLALGVFSLRASVGVQLETGRRPGPYLTLAAWRPL